jgi:predicted PurR-regulated permease PerM
VNGPVGEPRKRPPDAASGVAAVDRQRPALAVAAERSLQLLLIAAALTAIVFVLVQLRLVVLPVIAAIFFATVLAPIARRLRAHRWPPALAALTTMVIAAAVFAGLMAAIVPPLAAQIDELGSSAREGLDEALTWLTAGPIGLSERDINQAVDQGLAQLRDSSDLIAGGVISGALLVGEIIAGILLTAILLFFFLKDGDRLWSWLIQLAPASRRDDVDDIGRRSWSTLSGYLRGISIVALIDAVLIGVALAIIGVPLVLPLMVLTFVAAFIPLVGAVIAGAFAALVALVAVGPWAALLVILAITIIQQLEGDLIYPLVVGQAVSLHPVAILLALTTGAVVAGVIGAILAVPVTAVIWTITSYLRDKPAHDTQAATPTRSQPA